GSEHEQMPKGRAWLGEDAQGAERLALLLGIGRAEPVAELERKLAELAAKVAALEASFGRWAASTGRMRRERKPRSCRWSSSVGPPSRASATTSCIAARASTSTRAR